MLNDLSRRPLSVMLAFGYRADEPTFPKTRRKMEDIVSWF